jgi:hypothetical protein
MTPLGSRSAFLSLAIFFVFSTPRTFSTITSTPRVAFVTTGSLTDGDEASLGADDNQWLQARAVGNPRTVAAEGLLPVSVVREVRDFKVHVSARATRTCSLTIDAWSAAAGSWVQLRSATLPTQETRYGDLSLSGRLRDYLLPDSSPNRSPTQRSRCARDVFALVPRVSISCSNRWHSPTSLRIKRVLECQAEKAKRYENLKNH